MRYFAIGVIYKHQTGHGWASINAELGKMPVKTEYEAELLEQVRKENKHLRITSLTIIGISEMRKKDYKVFHGL